MKVQLTITLKGDLDKAYREWFQRVRRDGKPAVGYAEDLAASVDSQLTEFFEGFTDAPMPLNAADMVVEGVLLEDAPIVYHHFYCSALNTEEKAQHQADTAWKVFFRDSSGNEHLITIRDQGTDDASMGSAQRITDELKYTFDLKKINQLNDYMLVFGVDQETRDIVCATASSA